jgi:hypothetical protein
MATTGSKAAPTIGPDNLLFQRDSRLSRRIIDFAPLVNQCECSNCKEAERYPFLEGATMFNEETRTVLRAVLDEVCEGVGMYHNAARAHVAARILSAARQDCTIEDLKEVGRDALKSAPTMWR